RGDQHHHQREPADEREFRPYQHAETGEHGQRVVERLRRRLPAGALVYIAVPPARDFATSGLENGLVLAYLGLLWWMMVVWG
ncbi:hypothetical protein C6A85_11340, partial [Mycobacterium sp. ITM-2017-0098]